jgi:hypothetical protein
MSIIEGSSKQSKAGSLKYLKQGRYMLVDNGSPTLLKHFPDGVEALLIEPQGQHAGQECWYAYAGGSVIVVWQDSFKRE